MLAGSTSSQAKTVYVPGAMAGIEKRPDALPGPPVPEADAPPDLFGAMEQQLGLHLQKTRTNVLVMVIDKVEKPSEN